MLKVLTPIFRFIQNVSLMMMKELFRVILWIVIFQGYLYISLDQLI